MSLPFHESGYKSPPRIGFCDYNACGNVIEDPRYNQRYCSSCQMIANYETRRRRLLSKTLSGEALQQRLAQDMTLYSPRPLPLPITDIEGEVWKDVPGYVGFYRVSDHGRVLSFLHNSEYLMRGRFEPEGGYTIRLSRLISGEGVSYVKLHRLVMMTFAPIPDAHLHFVKHLDRDRKNNHLSNLRWAHHSEHTHSAKLSDEQVRCIWHLWRKGWTYKQLAAEMHAHRSTIERIIYGERYSTVDLDDTAHCSA